MKYLKASLASIGYSAKYDYVISLKADKNKTSVIMCTTEEGKKKRAEQTTSCFSSSSFSSSSSDDSSSKESDNDDKNKPKKGIKGSQSSNPKWMMPRMMAN